MFLGTADEDTFHLIERHPTPKKWLGVKRWAEKKRKKVFRKAKEKKYFKKVVKKIQNSVAPT